MVEPAEPDKRPRRRWIILGGIITVLALFVLLVLTGVIYIPLGEFCSWEFTGQAWIDENADGIWDENEPPLEGVQFHLNYASEPDHDVNMEEAYTDSHGDVSLGLWTYSCAPAKFAVYPDIPSGYRLTTKASVTRTTRQQDTKISFGFAYLPGTPTVTPCPPGPN